MDSRPSIGVVTVTHNSAHVLDGFLDQLSAETAENETRVVVVDSGSSAIGETKRISRQSGAAFVPILENVGYGTASNRGAQGLRRRLARIRQSGCPCNCGDAPLSRPARRRASPCRDCSQHCARFGRCGWAADGWGHRGRSIEWSVSSGRLGCVRGVGWIRRTVLHVRGGRGSPLAAYEGWLQIRPRIGCEGFQPWRREFGGCVQKVGARTTRGTRANAALVEASRRHCRGGGDAPNGLEDNDLVFTEPTKCQRRSGDPRIPASHCASKFTAASVRSVGHAANTEVAVFSRVVPYKGIPHAGARHSVSTSIPSSPQARR